jgi:hypothetical protein
LCVNYKGLAEVYRFLVRAFFSQDFKNPWAGMDLVVLIYFGYTVTVPWAMNTKQLIHLEKKNCGEL